ncbi:MAG: hypothetical protein MUC50_22635, partial [Myxococcota bacterium]|nr:hypothetical protein [Myxococcota bacterium]
MGRGFQYSVVVLGLVSTCNFPAASADIPDHPLPTTIEQVDLELQRRIDAAINYNNAGFMNQGCDPKALPESSKPSEESYPLKGELLDFHYGSYDGVGAPGVENHKRFFN